MGQYLEGIMPSTHLGREGPQAQSPLIEAYKRMIKFLYNVVSNVLDLGLYLGGGDWGGVWDSMLYRISCWMVGRKLM